MKYLKNRRRETSHAGFLSKLFESYTTRPPRWVYIIEMIVVVLLTYVLLDYDGEVVRVLLPLLLEKGS